MLLFQVVTIPGHSVVLQHSLRSASIVGTAPGSSGEQAYMLFYAKREAAKPKGEENRGFQAKLAGNSKDQVPQHGGLDN